LAQILLEDPLPKKGSYPGGPHPAAQDPWFIDI
jgi:hypothetical protein